MCSKEEINKYSEENNNMLIYRMSDKTSFNRRKFGSGEFRYVNKVKLELFKTCRILRVVSCNHSRTLVFLSSSSFPVDRPNHIDVGLVNIPCKADANNSKE